MYYRNSSNPLIVNSIPQEVQQHKGLRCDNTGFGLSVSIALTMSLRCDSKNLMEQIHSFDPIIDLGSRVLVLGSMPSVKSLAMGEYYAHPTNAFWPIMAGLCGYRLGTWQEKVAMLTNWHIALWDVAMECTREASSDYSIRNVGFNDIRKLLDDHSGIGHIICNGTVPMQLLKRYDRQLGAEPIGIPVSQLPSTSAANTLAYEEKLQKWHYTLRKVLDLSQ